MLPALTQSPSPSPLQSAAAFDPFDYFAGSWGCNWSSGITGQQVYTNITPVSIAMTNRFSVEGGGQHGNQAFLILDGSAWTLKITTPESDYVYDGLALAPQGNQWQFSGTESSSVLGKRKALFSYIIANHDSFTRVRQAIVNGKLTQVAVESCHRAN